MARADVDEREKKIRNRIDVVRRNMKALGVYKAEFAPIVRMYAELRLQYDEITQVFADSDYKFEVMTNMGTKKAPIVTTLESLRKDILSYATQLGLTPQGLLKVHDGAFAKKDAGPLAALLARKDEE